MEGLNAARKSAKPRNEKSIGRSPVSSHRKELANRQNSKASVDTRLTPNTTMEGFSYLGEANERLRGNQQNFDVSSEISNLDQRHAMNMTSDSSNFRNMLDSKNLQNLYLTQTPNNAFNFDQDSRIRGSEPPLSNMGLLSSTRFQPEAAVNVSTSKLSHTLSMDKGKFKPSPLLSGSMRNNDSRNDSMTFQYQTPGSKSPRRRQESGFKDMPVQHASSMSLGNTNSVLTKRDQLPS